MKRAWNNALGVLTIVAYVFGILLTFYNTPNDGTVTTGMFIGIALLIVGIPSMVFFAAREARSQQRDEQSRKNPP